MKSLFEKEEKENALNQLKIDLISRYFAFTTEQLVEFQSLLNFNGFHLMNNELIKWNKDLVEIFKDKIDWSALWKLKNITFDLSFFRTYEKLIDFRSIQFSKNIDWSQDLIDEFGDRFDWSGWLITTEPLVTIENLRRFQDKIDWSFISERIRLVTDEKIIDEFQDKWVWQKLSKNPHLPVTVEFIQKYSDKLDFNSLSENPQSFKLIFKYPASKKWNWDKIIINPAIVYSAESFEFIFHYFKKYLETQDIIVPVWKKHPLNHFLQLIFSRPFNNKQYFLNSNFISVLPWKTICKYGSLKLTSDLIDSFKHNINFKESEFIRVHREVITPEFIDINFELFNPQHYTFYSLPLNTSIIAKCSNKLDWRYLSSCEKFNWSWEFIDYNFEKFNLYRLSENRGIYNSLIRNKLSDGEILAFLKTELNLNNRISN